jgi:diguanylate cyclase (GGDEF)-like protein
VNPGRNQIESDIFELLEEGGMKPAVVEAMAGDVRITEKGERMLEKLRRERGGTLYTDLLFAVTHQYYPAEAARELWEKILKHKYEVSQGLGRNVGIKVAALDYLQNMDGRHEPPSLYPTETIVVVAEIALKDGLTGLYDHAAFMNRVHREFLRFRRYAFPMALIMADVDDFKAFNDEYGHPRGDKILAKIGEIFRTGVRGVDIPARYGGEEFAVLLPHTKKAEAEGLAERLRGEVETAFRRRQGMTMSFGVASCPENARSERSLLRKADKALYRSKAEGKNRVSVSEGKARSRDPV